MRATAMLLLLTTLASCSGAKPGMVAANRRGIPPGPGLLTGQSGELVIGPPGTGTGDAARSAGADKHG